MSAVPYRALLLAAAIGCGQSAESAGLGPRPTLPAPNSTLIPTMEIAPAKGWPAEAKPTAGAGLSVTAYATALDHPRWLYVLPNGDVPHAHDRLRRQGKRRVTSATGHTSCVTPLAATGRCPMDPRAGVIQAFRSPET
jgi:glucose/arabinose dehydrogenase